MKFLVFVWIGIVLLAIAIAFWMAYKELSHVFTATNKAFDDYDVYMMTHYKGRMLYNDEVEMDYTKPSKAELLQKQQSKKTKTAPQQQVPTMDAEASMARKSYQAYLSKAVDVESISPSKPEVKPDVKPMDEPVAPKKKEKPSVPRAGYRAWPARDPIQGPPPLSKLPTAKPMVVELMDDTPYVPQFKEDINGMDADWYAACLERKKRDSEDSAILKTRRAMLAEWRAQEEADKSDEDTVPSMVATDKDEASDADSLTDSDEMPPMPGEASPFLAAASTNPPTEIEITAAAVEGTEPVLQEEPVQQEQEPVEQVDVFWTLKTIQATMNLLSEESCSAIAMTLQLQLVELDTSGVSVLVEASKKAMMVQLDAILDQDL
ncbi:MAG: hypothetical protein SGARI_002069 [Bacillariaceae sp.]